MSLPYINNGTMTFTFHNGPLLPWAFSTHLDSGSSGGKMRAAIDGTRILYGISECPFKLIPSAENRGRKSNRRLRSGKRRTPKYHVIHLGVMKAELTSVFVRMLLLTFNHELAIGEFNYTARNRLIEVTNASAVSEVLTLDTTSGMDGTMAIPVTPRQGPINPITNAAITITNIQRTPTIIT